MQQIHLIKSLRSAIIVFIIAVSAFTLSSCNGCNSPTQSDTTKDSTTTTNMSDSTKMRVDTMPANQSDTSKGDQTLPPKK